MKGKVAKIFLALCLIVLCVFSSSCSENDGSNYLFKYDLNFDPKNLDPQLATDSSSLIVIQNMFEGLLKISETGTIKEGVATEFLVSDDGLTYTFNLRQNAFWTGTKNFSQNITADDFVFTFRRLVDPKTFSPYAEKFFCIKNAEKINKENLAVENLAVKANGKYQLTIELEYPNADFLRLLTTPPAMPCNEDFFYSTKGKYGLETDSTISNGAFYLTQWLYDPYGNDNFLILRRNQAYNEFSRVYPSGLNFLIVRDSENIIKDFKSGDTDCIVSNGENKDLFTSDNSIKEFDTISSGLVFNMQKPLFQIEEVRKSLSICVDRSVLANEIPKNVKVSYGLIPSGVTMLNKSFRELAAEPAVNQYNASLSQYLWESTLTKAEKNSLNNVTIIVPQSYAYSGLLNIITEQWRETLGFYCGIEVVSDEEYETRIKAGEYYIALSEIKGQENTPSAFLEEFETNNSKNIFGYSDSEFDELLASAKSLKSLTECLEKYTHAEKILTEKFAYLPMFYQKEYLVLDKNISDIIFDPFTKQIDFSIAKNKK